MDDKTCTTCKRPQPRTEFNNSTRAKDGLQPRCRSCDRAWYVRNAEEHKRNVRRRNDRVRGEWKERMASYLAVHPCVDCHEPDVRVLEFDHLDPRTKAGTVGRFVASSLPWHRIQAEIDKCVVRCSNCHRIRTMTDCGSWRVEAEQVRRATDAEGARKRLAGLLPTAGPRN